MLKTHVYRRQLLLAVSLLLYYAAWGIPQFGLYHMHMEQTTQRILFSFGFLAFAGILVPTLWVKRLNVRPQKGKLLWLGVVLTLTAIVVAIFGSGAYQELISSPPAFMVLLRYLLLFIPMTLSLSLVAFLLLPHLMNGKWFCIPAGGLFFFVGFMIDGGFLDMELAVAMGAIGLLLCGAHWAHGRFAISFAGLLLCMLGNTLVEGKYIDYPWLLLIPVFLLAAIVPFVLSKENLTSKFVRGK